MLSTLSNSLVRLEPPYSHTSPPPPPSSLAQTGASYRCSILPFPPDGTQVVSPSSPVLRKAPFRPVLYNTMKDSAATFLLSLPDLPAAARRGPGAPPGFRLFGSLRNGGGREGVLRGSVLLLTFLAYTAYHMSRKPISVVKNAREFLNCSTDRWETIITCTIKGLAATCRSFRHCPRGIYAWPAQITSNKPSPAIIPLHLCTN
jgi:hypothetical protein